MVEISPEKTLTYALMYVFGVGLFVLMMQNMPSNEAMSAWTFTGASMAAAIFPVLPWLFLVAIIIVPTYYLTKEFG